MQKIDITKTSIQKIDNTKRTDTTRPEHAKRTGSAEMSG
jgi:hypothetical protein